MKQIALAIIIFYRRFVSPYKGFSCAYRAYTGRASCSEHGYRAIERHGIFIGIALVKRRLTRCGNEYRKHRMTETHRPRLVLYSRNQAGFCDIGCDVGGCDAVDIGSCACDGFSACGPSPCDFGDWNRRKKEDDQYVEIGPGTMSRSTKGSRDV
jgi:uncharacterized protein